MEWIRPLSPIQLFTNIRYWYWYQCIPNSTVFPIFLKGIPKMIWSWPDLPCSQTRLCLNSWLSSVSCSPSEAEENDLWPGDQHFSTKVLIVAQDSQNSQREENPIYLSCPCSNYPWWYGWQTVRNYIQTLSASLTAHRGPFAVMWSISYLRLAYESCPLVAEEN